MILYPAELSNTGARIRVSLRFNHRGDDRTLWYELDRRWEGGLSADRADAFVVALLPLAMKSGEDIELRSPMSRKLYYNLTHSGIPIICLCLPHMKPVRILPGELTDAPGGAVGGVATGFSAGIDSFCVLAEHFFAPVPPSYRVTHLVINNTGSHMIGGERLFWERYQRLLPAAREMDLPLLAVNSNLDEVLPGVVHQQTHVPRNISVALLLLGLASKYYYASGVDFARTYIGPMIDLAYADPSLIHLFSTEGQEVISTGSQHTRVEKTRLVSDVELSYRYLDVCNDHSGPAGNCSRCKKCIRTLLALDVLGKLDLYSKVFDLDTYRRFRNRHLAAVVYGKDGFLREIGRQAKESGFPTPLSARLLGMAARLGGMAALKLARRLTGRRVIC